MHGYFPENFIDHINGKRDDNRIKNLREVSFRCNIRNSKVRNTNTSGVTGVTFDRDLKKWRASISVGKTTHYLGASVDFPEAVAHRLAGEQCLNWGGCNANTSAAIYIKKMLGGEVAAMYGREDKQRKVE
jgi:hypothetical protein